MEKLLVLLLKFLGEIQSSLLKKKAQLQKMVMQFCLKLQHQRLEKSFVDKKPQTYAKKWNKNGSKNWEVENKNAKKKTSKIISQKSRSKALAKTFLTKQNEPKIK